MKYLSVLTCIGLITLFMTSCSSTKEVIELGANESKEINFQGNSSYEASVSNKSQNDLEINIVDKESGVKVGGFGLAQSASEKVMISTSNKLVVTNTNGKNAKFVVKTKEKEMKQKNPDSEYVSFTLRNNSASSIPLIIPTVMNPNLSPFSNSGVDLKIGQEILFKSNGKKYVLLTVSNDIQNGDVLEVNKLLKKKKKELGI